MPSEGNHQIVVEAQVHAQPPNWYEEAEGGEEDVAAPSIEPVSNVQEVVQCSASHAAAASIVVADPSRLSHGTSRMPLSRTQQCSHSMNHRVVIVLLIQNLILTVYSLAECRSLVAAFHRWPYQHPWHLVLFPVRPFLKLLSMQHHYMNQFKVVLFKMISTLDFKTTQHSNP